MSNKRWSIPAIPEIASDTTIKSKNWTIPRTTNIIAVKFSQASYSNTDDLI